MGPHFSAPAYPGGRAAHRLYNAGPMLADDHACCTEEDSLMLLIRDSCQAEFDAYLQICQRQGWQLIFRSTAPGRDCAQFLRRDDALFVSFQCFTRQVRIIQDPHCAGLSGFSYDCSSREEPVIVQYGLYYDPDNTCTDRTMNCGMLYIIRLADGSLFLIDGGHEYQMSDQALEGLHDFLEQLAGTGASEPIQVAGWFFSHAHNDHIAAFCRLLRRWPGQFQVKRLLFNFPSYPMMAARGYESEIFILKETARLFCPDALCLKLHSGQKFTLAGTEFEVLYTHEDAVSPAEPEQYPFRDFNSTSSILKMTTPGGSILWLGDANQELQDLFRESLPTGIWKADAVQVAHHCINYLPELYQWAGAGCALLPNSRRDVSSERMQKNLGAVALSLSEPDRIYYEDCTTVFRFQNGRLEVIGQEPVIGGPHDGVDLYGNPKKNS